MWKPAFAFGLVEMLACAVPASATVFVIRPGMPGNPGADDPPVAYSSLALDEQFSCPDAPLVPYASEPLLRPWEQSWYQVTEVPRV